jgi:glutamine amidotransferase
MCDLPLRTHQIDMTDNLRVAIVDYGMGNLFSVQQACEAVGLAPVITGDPADVESADGVILPGVGAFGDAMDVLRERGLADALRRVASRGTPLFGVCLGMQLLMNESEEFGRHEGLGLIDGVVKRLPSNRADRVVKVPQVGWNRVAPETNTWDGTALADIEPGRYVYFIHSYYVEPEDPRVVIALTEYGGFTYCSALQQRNVHGLQFHPEKSGEDGITIYRNMSHIVGSWKASEARAIR